MAKQKEKYQAAVALALDLATAFERVSLPVVWAWRRISVSKEDIAGAVRLFRAPEARSGRRVRGGAASDHVGHLARVKMELLVSM